MKSITLSLLFTGLAASSLVCQAAEKRPNILFVLADDQSPFDLQVYSPDSILETPQISKMAAEGMTFDAAYHMGSWAGAVCTPSRHMIMSGRTVWHLPKRDKKKRKNTNKVAPVGDAHIAPENLANFTLAAVFNKAGYDTMRTCKKGNSYAGANQQFTIVHDATKRGGTDETGSAWHAEKVLDYLKTRDEKSAPFFIYFGFSHPHDVRDGKPELLAKYGAKNHSDKKSLPESNPKQPKLPSNYLPKHPFDNTHMQVRDEQAVPGVWGNRDKNTIRNELGREFACSENIDIQLGRVLAKLEAMGELENTYIIYTADHGMAIGRHGLQGKQNLYEHTLRVPFIVKGPGIKAGVRTKQGMYLTDVLATVCDLAGVEKPETNEGLSMVPVLKGESKAVPGRETLYGLYSAGAKPGMRSVNHAGWKLIKYEDAKNNFSHTQLFNLTENPNEYIEQHSDPAVIKLTGVTPKENQTNLAADPKHAAKLKQMEELLLQQMVNLDDPYRFSNQPKTERASEGKKKSKTKKDKKDRKPKKPKVKVQ